MLRILILCANLVKVGFSSPNFVFLEEHFWTRRKFPCKLNLGGGTPPASFPLPWRHFVFICSWIWSVFVTCSSTLAFCQVCGTFYCVFQWRLFATPRLNSLSLQTCVKRLVAAEWPLSYVDCYCSRWSCKRLVIFKLEHNIFICLDHVFWYLAHFGFCVIWFWTSKVNSAVKLVSRWGANFGRSHFLYS